MCIYGTDEEAAEVAAIARNLPYYEIIDPSLLQNDADRSDDGMRFFFRVINYCHAVVFSKLLGAVTAGVGLEVNHALNKQLPVYQLENGRVARITRSVQFLSREETIKQYNAWRSARHPAGTRFRIQKV